MRADTNPGTADFMGSVRGHRLDGRAQARSVGQKQDHFRRRDRMLARARLARRNVGRSTALTAKPQRRSIFGE
jgi:hypothetical protein